MNQNKTLLLAKLKENSLPFKVELEHVLFIYLYPKITLQQARRFIRTHPSTTSIPWNDMEDNQLETLVSEAKAYLMAHQNTWREEDKANSQQLKQVEVIKQAILPMLQIPSNLSPEELIAVLSTKLQQRNQLIKIHMNTESQGAIQAQNEQIRRLIELLRQTINYRNELEQLQLDKPTDKDDLEIIRKLVDEERGKLQGEAEMKKEKQQKDVVDKMQEYERKIIVIKRRLYQIFLFYCRENNSVGLTFEAYSKTAQLINLRLFLKYFKDYQYVQTNKYRFKVTTATQIFRNAATNGLSLNFQQFWLIHRQLFDLNDLAISRRDIIEAETQRLAQLKQKWVEQIEKLRELNEMVSEAKTKELLQFFSLKTESSSPEKTLVKNNSSMVASKITSHNSSKYLSKKAFSEQESELLQSRNFIQRVRAELQNAEQQSYRIKIDRSNSLSTLSPKKGMTLQVSLPKILKLSTEEISSQNIYQSLKRFSDEDYRNQEKKLRDLIGLSNGDEDKLMKHYMQRERQQKQLKQKQKSIDREIRRKKLLQGLAKKQHHCKKFNPKQIQPYMRF